MKIEVPSGYKLKPDKKRSSQEQGWILTKDESDLKFNITNRSFDLIDSCFNNRISDSIIALTSKQPLVRMVDVAGGAGSSTADDIVEQFGQSVAVYNADLMVHNNNDNENNTSPVRADALHLPFLDDSMDLAFSYAFLPNYIIRNMLNEELKILQEIRRVLKPGATAILDELYVSYLSSRGIRQVEEKLEVSIALEKRNIPFLVKASYFVYKPFRSPKYLVMTKPRNQ